MIKSKISPRLIGRASQHSLAIVKCKTRRDFAKIARNNLQIVREFPFISSIAVFGKTEELFEITSMGEVLSLCEVEDCYTFCEMAKEDIGVSKLNAHGLLGKGITVAVLDSGIAPLIDICGVENRIKAFYDVVNKREKPYDDNGHGTMIAGVIGGNGYLSCGKYAGVASGCQFVGVKCMNFEGVGNSINILDGMQWVYDNAQKYGISVVCMAFGAKYAGVYDPLVQGAEALTNIGLCVCAASGNDGTEGVKSPGVSKRVLTVGAFDDKRTDNHEDDEIASFSGRGGVLGKPDFLFPGVNVCALSKEGEYAVYSGTSVSCAICSGVAALIKQANNRADCRAIKSILNANSYVKGENRYVYF